MTAALITHSAAGDGDPVLLLNGGFMTMAAWQPIAAPLEAEFRVIRCDFRGQLMSPGQAPSSLDGHVSDVVAMLDWLGVEEVDVVGTSFGGFVGVAMAARPRDDLGRSSVRPLRSGGAVFLPVNEADRGPGFVDGARLVVHQARFEAEAGLQRTLQWFNTSYTAASVTYGTSTDTATYGNPTWNGQPVVLSAMTGTASNYPTTSIAQSYSSTLRNDLGATGVQGNYSTTATLLRTRGVLETWRVSSRGSIPGRTATTVQAEVVIERGGISVYQYGLTGTGYGCAFSLDGEFVFYTRVDDSWRPYQVWRHRVGALAESPQHRFDVQLVGCFSHRKTLPKLPRHQNPIAVRDVSLHEDLVEPCRRRGVTRGVGLVRRDLTHERPDGIEPRGSLTQDHIDRFETGRPTDERAARLVAKLHQQREHAVIVVARPGHQPPGNLKLQRRHDAPWRMLLHCQFHEHRGIDGIREIRNKLPAAPIAYLLLKERQCVRVKQAEL